MTMVISPINVFLGICWSNEYCVGFFFWHGRGKMDPDKSVVFGYDGVPAHLDLAIPAQYEHSLCDIDIVEKDLSCLKATPKADISSPEI